MMPPPRESGVAGKRAANDWRTVAAEDAGIHSQGVPTMNARSTPSPARAWRWALPLAALSLGLALALPVPAAVVYQNDFNNPVGWTDQSGNGTGISFANVNTLYGSAFQQTFTVETIKIAGNPQYSDPSGTGGAYSLGMLSSVQNDLLSLTFSVGSLAFVNIEMDFAGIGPAACPLCGGPFARVGETPIFDLSLYDTPLGSFNINSPGTALSTGAMTGAPIASITTLGWNHGLVSLSTAGNTNGTVTLLIDLRAGTGMAGYSAFDNLLIASSDTPGGPPPGVPEPASLLLAGLGWLLATGRVRRSR